ncbi:MAG TPA: lytic transglycosylase domain-containing protein [Bauldia sp.]|nr:lytic transglycosylase domain-containing protein [Bauldia sp.]
MKAFTVTPGDSRSGAVSRRRGLALTAAIAALAVAAFAEPGPAEESPFAALTDIPLPRLNPQRAHSDAILSYTEDPIGSLLTGAIDDDHTTVKTEDAEPATSEFTPVIASRAEPPSSRSNIGSVGLRYAIKFLDEGDYAAATAAAYALPSPVDTKIIDWLVATSGDESVPSSHIAEVWRRLADWPGQTLLQTRYEQALVREKPPAAAIIQAMSGRKPVTEGGAMLLTRSYLDVGKKREAAAVIGAFWRNERFEAESEARIRKEFGSLLSAADYKARLDRLLYEEQHSAATRNAKYLNANEVALTAAVVAVDTDKNASGALGAVPAAKRSDPLYHYARVRYLRRADKIEEAAQVLLSAPRDPAVIDGDAWWVERRIVSRALLDKGDARTAYRIAAAHSAETSADIAEAEFHAGWYALEFLDDPATASKHFAEIERVSQMPLSQSRAEYWLGRAAERAGNRNAAVAHYKKAGRYPTTFYGQLALSRLGVKQLPIAPAPRIDAAAKKRFNENELVQVILKLDDLNRGDRNSLFFKHLADTLTDPAEIALLCEMAEEEGGHQFALQLGKMASYRNLPVHASAFPISAIPSSAKTSVEKPMVYAIARQESAFNPAAVSAAGARGLLQLMPATAKAMAKAVGVAYSQDRLTSDPAYNAQLGAAFLKKLHASYGGSFVMTFAAYNAGPSRVTAWVKQYGDPRDPDVDVVNWIERIPFTETRNYVQRIMENLQVYRARLGAPALTIESDLKRGRG